MAAESSRLVRLRVLGGIEVLGDGGSSVREMRARPKALALLAFLALQSRHGPCTRETIMVHFWPDSTMETARHALRQALYELRRLLGPDLIEPQGQHEVALNPACFSADVLDLLDALEDGRIDDAIRLYRGELLPGLHFADAPSEFEAWLDDARQSVRNRFTEQLWRAQAQAEASGEAETALRLGRHALDVDPYNEAGLRRVMALLHHAGRSAEAVQLFRRFRRRLAADLDLGCSPGTGALAAEIAAAAQVEATPGDDPAEIPPPAGTAHPSLPHASAPTPEPVLPDPALPEPAASHRPRSRAWRARGLAGLVLAVILGAAVGIRAIWSGSGSNNAQEGAWPAMAAAPAIAVSAGQAVLEVGPIRSRDGDPAAAAVLGQGVAWLMSGQEMAVGGRLAGSIEAVDGGWSVDLELPGPRGQRLVAFLPGDLVAAVRQVADAVAVALDVPRPGYEARRAMLPRNEAALRAMVRGEWLLERGELHAAADAFQRAAAYDPGFAVAHYRLSIAATLTFDLETAQRAEAAAVALAAQLPEAEALILEARRALRAGEPDQAEALLQSALTARPGHPDEVAYHAADLMFHYNPLRGRPVAEARPAFERVRGAWRAEALYHTLQAALLDGDHAAFDRASSALLEVAPAGVRNQQVRLLRARVLGAPDEWRRERARLAAARDLVVLQSAQNLAVYHRDLPAALDVLEILTRDDREPGVRARAHAARADLLAAAGRPADVAAELRSALALDPLLGASRAAHLLTLGVLPPADTALQAIARSIARADLPPARVTSAWIDVESALDPWLEPHARALAALALGDPAPARRLERQLRTDGPPDPARGILLGDLALRLDTADEATGAPDAAIDLRGVTSEAAVLSPLFSRPLGRLVQGRLHRERSQLRQADRWFGSLLEHSIPDLALAAVALGERARLARMRGDTDAARQFEARLNQLQAEADEAYLQWRASQPWAPADDAPAHGP
jgi:DNA-binding SARP family transcriptional activator